MRDNDIPFGKVPPSGVSNGVPARAGVGLKPEHYTDILRDLPDIGWFEVHPENYMGAGGPPHYYLTAIRERYPLSLHGVGLSIGSDGPLDQAHLARVKALVERYRPGLFSEHLAWSTHEDIYYNDLLPMPYNETTLRRIVDHLDEIQSAIGMQVLLENPTRYLRFQSSTMEETTFLKSICDRSGCGLLLDINNVFISANNLGFDPVDYLAEFPLDRVGEIHLAGHTEETDDQGEKLLIDTHDRPVCDPVMALFERVLSKTGPLPSLIERDSDIPDWPDLKSEVDQIAKTLQRVREQGSTEPKNVAIA